MNAAYRLMGNFPSRGFGDSLSSADFYSGAAIVSGTDARLPMNGVPRVRMPQVPGEVTEAYHAYEIHPLSYGKLAVIYSATGAMMQANGAATRPCSYSNAVTWVGEDAPECVTDDAAMCSMLRYNDFVTLQELWVLPRDISALPTKRWVEDQNVRLNYAPVTPMSNEMMRSLLAHYWRAATLQFFGPWESGKHMTCLYQDDLLLQHISNRDRNFTVCISRTDDCQELVPLARGFLWQMILKKLPSQVRNIVSMAAAVPQQHSQSLYRDAAMCVVYPSPDAKFDFTTGKFTPLEADEDQFMQQVMNGEPGNLLRKMHGRYTAITGRTAVDACSFMADYDLALALYRISHTTDAWVLLSNWYAVQHHLTQRHEIRDNMLGCVMQDVDEYVATQLQERAKEVAQLLTSQTERFRTLMASRLQSFLWEKAVSCGGSCSSVLTKIVQTCHECAGAIFFAELPAAQSIPADGPAEQRMAAVIAAALKGRYTTQRLMPVQAQQLMRITPVYRQSRPISEAIAGYLTAYQEKHPEDRIRLLNLTTQYLDPDGEAAQAYQMLTGRLDTPITEDECKAIGSIWQRLKSTNKVQAALSAYVAALYMRYFDDLAMVNQIAIKLGMDTTTALVNVFTTAPACQLRLDEQKLGYALGQNSTAECLLAAAQDLPRVEEAYRRYLTIQLEQSIRTGESLYGWIVAMINCSLSSRLYANGQDKERFLTWCTQLVMDYTLGYAKANKRLPAEESFERLYNLASKKSPVFINGLPHVLEAYEELLLANAPDAERQAKQLAPFLMGMRNGTRLQEVTSSYISTVLQGEFQKNSLWQVMNRKDIIGQIQRAGALPAQIFDEATQQTAVNAIRRELLEISQPQQYRSIFANYASSENLFQRSVAVPGFLEDKTISMLWRNAAAECFLDQFAGFLQDCETIDDAKGLISIPEQLTNNMRQLVSESLTGRVIRRLTDVQGFLHGLQADPQLFTRVVEKAMHLRALRSEKALQLVQKECEARLEHENNFVRRVALAMMHSVSFRGYDWAAFTRILEPEMDGMTHSPYATGSLPLLAVVSGVLKLFENTQTQDMLLQSFVGFLQLDETMSSYTAAVQKDQKSKAQFFPGLENSASLRAWLEC